MEELNLPKFDFKLKQDKGKIQIFDEIRKKYIVLTPEEWVRQHLICHMIYNLSFPKTLLKVESGLIYNSLRKRSDILSFDNEGNPLLLIECKNPKNKINQNSVDQVTTYNKSINARYLMISNGINHFFWKSQKNPEIFREIPGYDNIATS